MRQHATTHTAKSDFALNNHGSLSILTPLTSDAKEWIAKHVSDKRMYFGSGIVIEPRYVPAILDGITADGLTIQ